MNKQVKCRKPHVCDACGLTIEKGELADFHSSRNPVYDYSKCDPRDPWDEGKQTSIYYYHGWTHPSGNQKCREIWEESTGANTQGYPGIPTHEVSDNDNQLPF